MKKILWILTAVLTLASCEKGQPWLEDPFEAFKSKKSYSPKSGMIWDIMPVDYVMVVTDADGNNLFDESTPGNWLKTPFSATFDGKEFQWPNERTKEYLAILSGFYIYPSWYTLSDEVILRFGELDGTDTWDTDLCITWPDGSQDTIRLQHAFRWDKDGNPDTYTGFKLNGEAVEGIVRLTK